MLIWQVLFLKISKLWNEYIFKSNVSSAPAPYTILIIYSKTGRESAANIDEVR